MCEIIPYSMASTENDSISCECYECTEPMYEITDDNVSIINDVHGKLQPCENCGREKTEKVELPTMVVYECWWCTDRMENSVGGYYDAY